MLVQLDWMELGSYPKGEVSPTLDWLEGAGFLPRGGFTRWSDWMDVLGVWRNRRLGQGAELQDVRALHISWCLLGTS